MTEHWYKPNRSHMKGVRYSSEQHKSCWDCTHIRVAGFPSRKCELEGYPTTRDDGFICSIGTAEQELDWMEWKDGKTIADKCDKFEFEPGLENARQTTYADEDYVEERGIRIDVPKFDSEEEMYRWWNSLVKALQKGDK